MTSYTIEFITDDDVEEALEFIGKFFLADEPLCRLLNYDKKKASDYFEHIADGLNLKAVSNGKIIGIKLHYITHKDDVADEDPNLKNSKILALLEFCKKQADVFNHYPGSNKVLFGKIIAVDKSWRSRGVATQLYAKTNDIAKERGCQVMAVICTSYYTTRALQKLNYDRLYEIQYEDYKKDGKVVFDPEHPHRSASVYAKQVV